MYVKSVSSIPWLVENPVMSLKWAIKSRMGCLASIFAKFLFYMYLSLKCLIMAAKAHSGCPYHKGHKPQKKKKLPENAKGKCLPLFNIHGVF